MTAKEAREAAEKAFNQKQQLDGVLQQIKMEAATGGYSIKTSLPGNIMTHLESLGYEITHGFQSEDGYPLIEISWANPK